VTDTMTDPNIIEAIRIGERTLRSILRDLQPVKATLSSFQDQPRTQAELNQIGRVETYVANALCTLPKDPSARVEALLAHINTAEFLAA
jgi:hypothetical protein